MIRYLIKNYIKLMSRSKMNFLLLIICPIIVMSVLSSAFKDLLAKYDGKDKIYAGYKVQSNDISKPMIDALASMAEDESIFFTEYKNEDPKDAIRNEDIDAFVVFNDDTYKIYENKDEEISGKIIEYMVSAFYENAGAMSVGITRDDVNLTVKNADYIPPIDSVDYYGIIEVIYFGWCAIVCGAAIFLSEKKYNIGRKLQVSTLNDFQIYLSKFIPLATVVAAESIITMFLSMILFDVHWGNIPVSLLILVISVAASSAFGLMIYNISNNMVITVIGVFSIVWFAGFFGGSFETYMFSSHPMSLKLATPIYHVNRSLTELSVMGHSDYVLSAILYCSAIVIICSSIAVLAARLRRRGRA